MLNFHRNHDCTANKWLDLEAPIVAHICVFSSNHDCTANKWLDLETPIVAHICVFSSNHDCTANKWLDLEAPIVTHICVFSSMPIFIQIVNYLDQFKSQILIEYIGKFKRDYFAHDDTQDKHCYRQHRKPHVPFRLEYLHLTWAHYKGQGQGHAHFNC